MSTTGRPERGICIVTVERQTGHLLITVRSNQNLDPHRFSVRPEEVSKFADVGAAVEATASFLHAFEAGVTAR